MKSYKKLALLFLVIAGVVAALAWKLLSRSEYAELKAADLTAFVDTLSVSRKQELADTEAERKKEIGKYKQAFALAQVAEAEGLHKSERFKWQMFLDTDQVLADEYIKQNISSEERVAYADAHQQEFDQYLDKEIEKSLKAANQPVTPEQIKKVKDGMSGADSGAVRNQWNGLMTLRLSADRARQAGLTVDQKEFDGYIAFVNKESNPPPTPEEIEEMKSQMSEVKLCANKARQDGLDKKPPTLARLKFRRATLLASLYKQMFVEKNKLTDAEKKKYLVENPGADIEKLRETAQGLLDRVKNGEGFDEVAKRSGYSEQLPWFAQDGTRLDGGGKMDGDFVKAIFALQKGETSKELVKTSIGFHIIHVDDRRMAIPPSWLNRTPATPNASPVPKPTPWEEIHARHIVINAQEAESFEQKLILEKVNRAIENATLDYPVNAPPDFIVKIPRDPNRVPGLGGGQSGTMRGITPQENK